MIKKKRKLGVGNKLSAQESNWSFSGKTVFNFDNHIKKSIPLYNLSHQMGLKISDFFLPNGTKFYDLGCSTGSFINNLAKRHKNKQIKIYGIDEVKQMVEVAKKKNKKFKNVKVLKKDITKFNFKNANFISSFYTIQFIRPFQRQKIINKIYNSLIWGGGFLFFEKVRAPDARFQDITTLIYNDFKREQGFTSNEILNKSKSLKGVLEPFSTNANIDMLKRAGFKDFISIFKYNNFEGILAIK
jgi:tRNA (cmo5U34)-methyltransferase